MGKDYIVTEFQKSFPTMTTKLKETDEKTYDYGILHIYLSELEKGFKVKRINKPTSTGIKVSYVPIKDLEHYKLYTEEIELILEEFNKKYNENISLT